MSSNDKTTDLLVATTRASKDDNKKADTAPAAATDAAKAKATPTARKKVAKKPAAKKAVAKAPAKPKQKVKEVETLFSFGRRVWPD